MKIQILTGLCSLVSAGCLLAGYCLAELWFIWLVLLGMILIWIVFCTKSGIWPISFELIVYLVLAVSGLLVGLSPYLMIIGFAAALVLWDLVLLRKDTIGGPALSNNLLLEQIHLKVLAIATGLGLFLSMLSLNIHILLPFGIIAGLSLLAAFGLFQGFRSLIKNHNPD